MYALIHNNQIEVGPRSWLASEFREYLTDNSLDASGIPRNAPTEPIITDNYQILPVRTIEVNFDRVYEQPVGPAREIFASEVVATYTKTDLPIEVIKNNLKGIVANNRYRQEVANIEVTVQGTPVKCYTTREDRNTYLDALQLIPDGTTFNFKFPLSGGIFLSLTKADMLQIVQAVVTHVQTAFSWEAGKIAEIEAATTIPELKAIVLTYSV